MIRKDMDIMNLEVNPIINRCLFIVLLLTLCVSLNAINFNASLQRFLNENQQTEFEINYKIFNDQLKFIKSDNAYIATIDVSIAFLKDNEVITKKEFSNSIGARTDAIAISANHYFLDKISVALSRDDLVAELTITDRNTSKSSKQIFPLKTLSQNALISDLEISQNIKSDNTKSLEKFHRGDYLFYVDPIPIFSQAQDSLFFYYEIYNLSLSADSLYHFTEQLTLKQNDSLVVELGNAYTIDQVPFKTFKSIPINDLKEGFYQIDLTINDLKTQTIKTSTSFFSKRVAHANINRIFDDEESEYLILSYFMTGKEKKLWKNLDENGRKNFIDRFWKSKDPSPKSPENEFLINVKKRIEVANWRYSHFDKGWTTDLGRIYLKNGEPDEKIEKTTAITAKYSKKDYQIWKYNYGSKIYIFMDMFNSGKYRLIYAKNDYNETTDPKWRSYFETDWDESLIDESSDTTKNSGNDWLNQE